MSPRGFTLLELILCTSFVATGILAFSKGVILFYRDQNHISQKAQNQLELALLSVEISHIGRLAKSCSKTSTTTELNLECDVEFTPGLAEKAKFQFEYVNHTLTYLKNGKPLGRSLVSGFSICSGGEIKSGTCIALTNRPWNSYGIQKVSLSNYFWYKIVLFNPSSNTTALQSGFSPRNNGTVRYRWNSWGVQNE